MKRNNTPAGERNGQETQVKDYFEEIARTFDSYYRDDADTHGLVGKLAHRIFRKPALACRFDATFRLLKDIRDKHILDVGCGSGIYCIEIARRGGRATGVDIAGEMIELSRENAGRAGVADRCTFVQMDLSEFCESSTPFDALIAIGLFDYISPEKQRGVLERLFAASAKDVVVAFPKKWVPGALVRKLWFLTKKLDVYYFTRRRIRGLHQNTGYAAEFINCGPLWCVRFYRD
ncbi:MAG TPA: class I SAM-dependent methyltransferase [Candidatus Aminicenantes bacterium]|nr:class I SAM-dependent methyltransferase [Candidatus Aminicenantes bacterium]